MIDIDKIVEILEINIPKENIYKNEPMGKHTTFKIGGNADIFVKVKKVAEIKYILDIAQKENINVTVIGNGSNILVKDKGIRGIVIKIDLDDYEIIKDKNNAYVKVDAGMLNGKLAQILLKEEISGFEFASGIPGTVGGAIKMNAGAYGSEFKNIVEETTYIDLEDNNKIKTISNEKQDFSYRHSIFQIKKAVILQTKLKLNYGKKDEIATKMEENLQSRKSKQPIDKPSAGSTFKRGTNYITAALIDQCGLKGKKVGGAEVSTKHAGFIINSGNATAEDIIKLTKLVQEQVFEKTGNKIELEIQILGE